jgi:hypothetical protein
VKHSNKFVAKSFGFTIAAKATAATIKIASKKTRSASVGGSGVTRASMHLLELIGSGSSVSDDETTPRELPRKCPRKFPLPNGVPKPSVMKGNFD